MNRPDVESLFPPQTCIERCQNVEFLNAPIRSFARVFLSGAELRPRAAANAAARCRYQLTDGGIMLTVCVQQIATLWVAVKHNMIWMLKWYQNLISGSIRGPWAALLYPCPSPAGAWSAAAVLSGLCSGRPRRKHDRLQPLLLDAFVPLILWWGSLLLASWGISGGAVDRWRVSGWIPCGRAPLTLWTPPYSSWECAPPLQCIFSQKGLDEEFTVGASGNLHTTAHHGCE